MYSESVYYIVNGIEWPSDGTELVVRSYLLDSRGTDAAVETVFMVDVSVLLLCSESLIPVPGIPCLM